MTKKTDRPSYISRRDFVKGTAGLAATASAFTIVKPQSVRGSQANSMVEIGWVGCGGQGTRDAELLEATGKAKIVALGDYFPDQLDKARDKFKVEPKNCFKGIDSYQSVIGAKVDGVLLTTPPGFRPQHFKAAIAAKKHTFAEKPLAVDVPGCHVVMEAGETAKAQNLSVVVGLQRHYSKAYRACKKLIDEGALGQVAMTHSAWDTDEIWKDRRGKRADSPSQMDYEMRYWYFFKWLSGDHIVEQSIHNIDVISWMLNAHPIKASGSGGRFINRDIGNIWDHFSIVYEYPNSVTSNHTAIQVDGVRGDISETIRGTKGTFTTTHGKGGTGGVRIEGIEGKKDVEAPIIYKYEGTDDKHYDQEAVAFINSVLGIGQGEDKYRNDTKYGVESTFTTILGREAAYKGETISWERLWNSSDRLSFKS